VQIDFVFTDNVQNVRILCLSCNVKKAQATAKLSDRADTIVVLIIFNSVFDHVRTCTVTVPFCSLYTDQVSDKNILENDRIYRKFPVQIEQ